MTAGLPASGQLSMGDISVEILRATTAQTELNETDVRTLFGKGSNDISYSDGYSKRWVTPGSNSGGAGSYSFYINRYATFTVDIRAGGGGSGGGCGNDGFAYGYCGGCGGAGGDAAFYSPATVYAYGGGGGCPGSYGGGGSGYGGTVYVDGAGNGGGGCGGSGGSGGRVVKTWSFTEIGSGAPAWFSTISVSVGGGGGGGGPGEAACGGSSGGGGACYISWG